MNKYYLLLDYKYGFEDLIPKDSILLMSGGLDSFVQWRLLGQPKMVYFAIGHKAQDRELNMLQHIYDKFGGEMNISHSLTLGRWEQNNGYIPFRNLLFLIQATNYSQNIVICQIAEWAPDKNKSFYRKTEKLLKSCGTGTFQKIYTHPKIYAPFSGYTKTQLVHEYIKRYPASDLTNYTTSCYSGHVLNCGECHACMSRHIAMTNNGIYEEYEHIPDFNKFRKNISVKDFHINQIPMYIKRWKEVRQYKKCLKNKGELE